MTSTRASRAGHEPSTAQDVLAGLRRAAEDIHVFPCESTRISESRCLLAAIEQERPRSALERRTRPRSIT